MRLQITPVITYFECKETWEPDLTGRTSLKLMMKKDCIFGI